MSLGSAELTPLKERLLNELQTRVSTERLEHILRVRHWATVLFQRFKTELNTKWVGDLSPGEVLDMAALIHDFTKEEPHTFHTRFLNSLVTSPETIPAEAAQAVSGDELEVALSLGKGVLHSKTASLYVAQLTGFFHEDVHRLVWNHTLCSLQPDLLEKVFLAADYLGSNYLFRKFEDKYPKKVKKLAAEKSLEDLIVDKQAGNLESFIKGRKRIPDSLTTRYNLFAR